MTDLANPVTPEPSAALPDGPPAVVRPGLPRISPTRAQYLLLVVVLLLAGAFAGQVAYNAFWATSWSHTMSRCLRERPAGPNITVGQLSDYLQHCTGPAEQQRALVSLTGALAVVVLGGAIMRVLPQRLLRRAGPVTTASEKWQQQAATAAGDMGITRVPLVVWGSVWLEEPFTAGRPGRVSIVLPVGVRALPPAQADALLRHELAHVAVGDVRLVWLTRGVLWALPPVLLIPLVVILIQTWRTAHENPLAAFGGAFWWEYAFRAALLITVSALVSQLVLRSREYEADARSVHGRSSAAMEALLVARPATALTWWKRVRANHPPGLERVAALSRGPLPLRISLLETAAVGVLGAMALDAVTSLAEIGLTGTPWSAEARLVGAVTAGGLLSVVWGTATWRTVIASGGTEPVPRSSLLVLGVSTALGLLVQFERTGTTGSGTLFGWYPLTTVPVAMAGAGAVSVALAGLWARRRRRPDRAGWDRVAAVCVNAILFVGALRIAEDTALALQSYDWHDALIVSGMYATTGTTTAVALSALALITLWAALSGGDRHAPFAASPGAQASRRWRTFRVTATTIAGSGTFGTAATSLVAAAAAVATRWTFLPAAAGGAASVHSIEFDWWSAAGAGGACLVVLIALRGTRGQAEALYAAPLATLLASAALWGRHFAEWKDPVKAAEHYAVGPLAQVAFLILLLGVPSAFLPARRTPRMRRARTGILLVAALSTAVVLAILRSGTRLLELS